MRSPSIEPRQWQAEAFRKFRESQNKVFLAVATPGSGKTVFAGMCAESMHGIDIEFIIIVCPTTRVKTQWAETISKFGIEIDPWYTNGECVVNKSFSGIAVTYQSIQSKPDLYEALARRRKTLVIFDEIHHMGKEMSWGLSSKRAFANYAVKVLCLSGTPFRSDNSEIPFLEYELDDEGKMVCRADYTFGYKQGLISDPPCVRSVVFNACNNRVKYENEDGVFEVSLTDDVYEVETARFKDFAFHPYSDWVKSTVEEVDAQLTVIRDTTHKNAACLVLAKTQWAAEEIGKRIGELTGDKVVVVHSNVNDPDSLIDEFKEGTGKWIVAVNMIAEGVDIPRLRCLIYLTRCNTRMFFMQAMGRIVRYQSDLIDESPGQEALFYMPRYPSLEDLAREVEEDVKASAIIVEEREERAEKQTPEEVGDDGSFFRGIETEATDVAIIKSGDMFEMDEVPCQVKDALARLNLPGSAIPILMNIYRHGQDLTNQTPGQIRDDIPEFKKREARRRQLNREINSIVKINFGNSKFTPSGKKTHQAVYGTLKYKMGGKPVEKYDEGDHEKAMKIVKEWREYGFREN